MQSLNSKLKTITESKSASKTVAASTPTTLISKCIDYSMNDVISSSRNSMTKNNDNNNLLNNISSTNSSSKNSLSDSNTTKWIEKFCSTDKFLCKIDLDFLTDSFNLIGLDEKIPHYHKALSIILGDSSDDDDDGDDNKIHSDIWSSSDNFSSDDGKEIEILSSAENLYGLIHARYILTENGLKKMLEKYKKNRFGLCNRYYCDRAAMLPIGMSDQPGIHPVRLYCPRCMDLYAPHFSTKSVLSDGAWFGTSFPHMFFMVYPEHRPLPPVKKFIPTLYGFKIHPKAYEYQRERSESAERAKMPQFLKSSPSTTLTTTANAAVINTTNPLSSQSHKINGLNKTKCN